MVVRFLAQCVQVERIAIESAPQRQANILISSYYRWQDFHSDEAALGEFAYQEAQS